MPLFDMNQTSKILIREKAVTFESFVLLVCFIFALNPWEKLQSYEKYDDTEVSED